MTTSDWVIVRRPDTRAFTSIPTMYYSEGLWDLNIKLAHAFPTEAAARAQLAVLTIQHPDEVALVMSLDDLAEEWAAAPTVYEPVLGADRAADRDADRDAAWFADLMDSLEKSGL
jgi:hypothetical protein